MIAVLSLGLSRAEAATLNLTPAAKTVAVGQTFTVDVQLDTKGAAIDGVDLYFLKFDPKVLEVVDSNPGTSGIQISPGNSLALTLANSANNATGQIQFSQTVSAGSTFTGTAKLATITFKAKSAGTSNLSFDFRSGSTTDTNVASRGSDALTSVGSAKYVVTAAESNQQPQESQNTTQDTNSSTVPGSNEENNMQSDRAGENNGSNWFLWAGIGLLLVIAGIAGISKLRHRT